MCWFWREKRYKQLYIRGGCRGFWHLPFMPWAINRWPARRPAAVAGGTPPTNSNRVNHSRNRDLGGQNGHVYTCIRHSCAVKAYKSLGVGLDSQTHDFVDFSWLFDDFLTHLWDCAVYRSNHGRFVPKRSQNTKKRVFWRFPGGTPGNQKSGRQKLGENFRKFMDFDHKNDLPGGLRGCGALLIHLL